LHSSVRGKPKRRKSIHIPYKKFIIHIPCKKFIFLKVLSRFFGSKSSKYPVKSIISPDGNFILSGSEDGKPYLWNFANKELQDSEIFQLSLLDSVLDVSWSTNFHVIACSGFGKEYPILVYFWEKEGEINVKDYKFIMEKVNKKEKEELNFQENPDPNYNAGNSRNEFFDRGQNQENVRVGNFDFVDM